MSLGGRRKINLRRSLVVIQIAGSLVLLISTGLFIRAFQRGETVSENFRSNKILILNLSPTKYGYSVKYDKAFYRELLARVGETPGVESVTLSNMLPLTMERSHAMVSIEGRIDSLCSATSLLTAISKHLTFPFCVDEGLMPPIASRRAKLRSSIKGWLALTGPNENPLGKVLQMDQPYGSLESPVTVHITVRTSGGIALLRLALSKAR